METIINKETITNILDTYFSQGINDIQNKTTRNIITAICLISALTVIISLLAIPCIIAICTISYWAIPVGLLVACAIPWQKNAFKQKISSLLATVAGKLETT